MAEAYPNAPAGLWARLTLADVQLSKGVNDLFEDRGDGEEALKEAVEAYQYVLAHAPRGSLLVERATYGLGEALESQNELSDAKAQYEAVVAKWPDGAYSTQAKQRLADLEKASTKQFYDWFAKQEPKRKTPAANAADGKPPFDSSNIEEHPFEPKIKLNAEGDGK